MRTFLTVLVIVLCQFSVVHGATTFSDRSQPLSDDQINAIGGTVKGNRIFSGDLIFYIDRLKLSGFKVSRWPSGALIYEFAPGLTQEQRDAFVTACSGWSTSTPVRCQVRSSETDYVYVANHNGEQCAGQFTSCSAVGKIGGLQELFIYIEHWKSAYKDVIQHELAHAFGMIHEQSRRDRDSFVIVQSQNIKPGTQSNFDPEPDADTFTDYDFDSIMHYRNCAFSIHEGQCTTATPQYQTIVPKGCNRDTVGGRSITALDIEGMQVAYAASVLTLFEKKRKPQCGILDLSPQQVKAVCGANCGEVGALEYNKQEIRTHNDCGAFTANQPREYYQSFCDINKKELITYSWQHKRFECLRDGIPTTLHKLEVTCGCPHQTIKAQCTDYSSEINRQKVEKLIDDGDLRDQIMGRFIRRLLKWHEEGMVENSIVEKLPTLLLRNYNFDYFSLNVLQLHATTALFVGVESIFDDKFVLTMKQFKKLVDRTALDTTAL